MSKVSPVRTPRNRNRARLPVPRLMPLGPSDESLDRQVYKVLKQAMMSGQLVLGDRLSGRSIAEELNISPMPVREALKRLEGDGALSSMAKSAYVVPKMTPGDYSEILKVRLELEGLLVRHAAQHITDAEIEKAAKLQKAISDTVSWADVLEQNFRMHFIIYQAAHMPYALALVETIWLRVGPALNMIGAIEGVERSYESHPKLLEALGSHDSEAAEKILREDIMNNAEIIMQELHKHAA